MIRIIVVIYILLFFLFLMAAVFGLLGDRLSSLPIWKSEIWQTVRIPVIVVSVIAILTVLVFFFVHMGNKQAKAEREFAESQGWTYTESRNDPQGVTRALEARLEKICPEKKFDLGNSVTVESGRRIIVLFDCYYRVWDWGRKRSHGFACLIASDRFGSTGSQVDISRRNSVDRVLLTNQIKIGDSEFDRSFIVTSKDPASAKKTVNESLKAVLLDSAKGPLDYTEINIGPGGAVIILSAYRPFEEWLAIVDLAREIESAFK